MCVIFMVLSFRFNAWLSQYSVLKCKCKTVGHFGVVLRETWLALHR